MKNKRKQNPEAQTVILYGKHACFAAISNPKRKIKKIWVSDKAAKELPNLHKLPTPKIANHRDFDAILPKDAVHQGIAMECLTLVDKKIEDFLDSQILLVLDQVTDPHNVGAMLRSCAAFGAAAVIAPKDNAPKESGVMAKSASGAMEIVPICNVTNLQRALEKLKKSGFWVVGLDGHTKTELSKANLSGKIALVMGAEGRGLRKLTKDSCDILVKLPISEAVESLNVSNAAAISLYEISRNTQS